MKTPTSTLATGIDEALRSFGDAAPIVYLHRNGSCERALSPATMQAEVRMRAAMLERLVPHGGRALVLMETDPEFVITLFACIYAGIVAIPLPTPRGGSAGDRLDAVLADAAATAILCTAESAGSVRQHLAGSRAGADAAPILVVDAPSSEATAAPTLGGFDQSPEATVVVQYTSGSTRAPKGVALSGTNILANLALIARLWTIERGGTIVSWAPHYHDLGLMSLLLPLLSGARTVQMSPLAFVQKPVRWLRAIGEYGATVSGGPAFAYGLCLDTVGDEDLATLDLSTWRTAFCGAEPIPPRLLERFRRHFAPAGLDPAAVFPCYGLAESVLFVAGEPRSTADGPAPPYAEDEPEPCRLSPATQAGFEIVDPETRQLVPEGAAGEIWVSGPSVMRGYVRWDGSGWSIDPDSPFSRIDGREQRYLRTGDLGRVDTAGLHILGRSKDVLIANGANVAAIDVEWLAAKQEPALNPLAAAAVPLARPDGSIAAALLIEMRDARHPIADPDRLAERIRRVVSATYGIDLHLIRFLKRGSLERTTSGKIRRHAIAIRMREWQGHDGVAT